MSDAVYARLTRYAGLYAVSLVVLVAVLAGALGSHVAADILFFAALVPVVFAWGHYAADLALNPLLDAAERTRWRVAFWLVPGSIPLYWHRHVRARRQRD